MKINNSPKIKVFAIFIYTVVIVVLGFAVYFGGTPQQARNSEFDTIREQHLYEISINAQQHLTPPEVPDVLYTDPETGEPYPYEIIDDTSFRICATFATDTSGDVGGGYNTFAIHGSGTQCFVEQVDETLRVKPLPVR